MTTPLRTQAKNAIRTLVAGVTFPSAVQDKSTWVSVSRKLKMFNDLDPSIQPCCFVVQHGETYESKYEGVPPRRIMEIGLWCFAYPGSEVDGDDYLDSMEEGIENAFATIDDVMRNELTLGGLVYSAKIERRGNLFIRDPGDIDGQALLILPVRILLP